MIRQIFIQVLLAASFLFPKDIPYVILISFDGFRWDYSERGITPNISEMKTAGVRAMSLEPSFPTKTFPNHLSIITGLYPENHGIIFNNFKNPISGQEYKLGDSNSVRDGKWYVGEAFWETAERNGITTASYYWPGSEVRLKHRRPSYVKLYDHNKPYIDRIEGVIEWLQLPEELRPHFITLYFHDTDSYGHKYGPNSEEINNSIRRLDDLIGHLNKRLKEIDLFEDTNIILVSDHGMTEIDSSKVINIETLLGKYKIEYGGTEPVMMLKPEEGEIREVYNIVRNSQNNFKAYLKEDFPEYYHFNRHPFIYPILLVADPGWSLVTNISYAEMINNYNKGNHGYDNHFSDMHGVFIASGPDFKSNYLTGSLRNIDIYPLLCRIFDIPQNSNLDGRLSRIEFILK